MIRTSAFVRTVSLPLLLVATAFVASAQTPAAKPPSSDAPRLRNGEVIRLWEGTPPGALGDKEDDIPTITVYMPSFMPPNRPAVLVCPGGAYAFLATDHEGTLVARYMTLLGYPAFVLRYRYGPRYHHPIELGDAQRALRLIRTYAHAWGIDPDKIGIMGFSAGGHLAMTASTHFDSGKPDAPDPIDRASSRPDFAVLGYPVISLVAPWTHQGSKINLLGEHADSSLAASLSGELSVSPKTPPTFLFTTDEDTLVPAENTLYYAIALRRAGVPVELHMFQHGEHGAGMAMTLAQDDMALSLWPQVLANWLRGNGFR